MGIGFGLVGTVLDGAGQAVEGFCDKVGLPEPVGDLAGGAVNLATGHYGAAVEDGIDLISDDGRGGRGSEPRAPQAATAVGQPVGPAAGGPGSPGFDPAATMQDMKAGKKPGWMDQKDWDMFQIQQQQAEYDKMINLITNLLKMQQDAQMAIIRNI
jgi:hypothetical protein